MSARPQPPPRFVVRLRAICRDLAGVDEHEAWTGTSWRVATSTFAHVVQIDDGWPPAYSRAFATPGPATVVTFQAAEEERHALGAHGHPFHLLPWRPGIVGAVIDVETDWVELAELITDSHRICLAPPRRTDRV